MDTVVLHRAVCKGTARNPGRNRTSTRALEPPATPAGCMRKTEPRPNCGPLQSQQPPLSATPQPLPSSAHTQISTQRWSPRKIQTPSLPPSLGNILLQMGRESSMLASQDPVGSVHSMQPVTCQGLLCLRSLNVRTSCPDHSGQLQRTQGCSINARQGICQGRPSSGYMLAF